MGSCFYINAVLGLPMFETERIVDMSFDTQRVNTAFDQQ
jgi:hypothetical protein